MLSVTAARADSALSFTLLELNQSGYPGNQLAFSATVANPSDSTVVMYLNSDSFNLDSPLIIDDSPYSNFPLSLNPGDLYTDVLFNVDIPLGASPGLYQGYFSILGEIDPVGTENGGATDTLATVDFSVNVNNASVGEGNLTPEPSSLVLLLTGMAVLAGIFRRRLILSPALH